MAPCQGFKSRSQRQWPASSAFVSTSSGSCSPTTPGAHSVNAVMGSIVQPDAHAPRGSLLTKPYVGSGYVLVIPPTVSDVRRLEDLPRGKVGVEHTSWPHYILATKKIETSS